MQIRNSTESFDKGILSQSLAIPSTRDHLDMDKKCLRHSDLVLDPVTSVNPLSIALPNFLKKYETYTAREVNAEDATQDQTTALVETYRSNMLDDSATLPFTSFKGPVRGSLEFERATVPTFPSSLKT